MVGDGVPISRNPLGVSEGPATSDRTNFGALRGSVFSNQPKGESPARDCEVPDFTREFAAVAVDSVANDPPVANWWLLKCLLVIHGGPPKGAVKCEAQERLWA